MKANNYIKKTAIVAICLMSIQFVYAAFSFTGIADEKNKMAKFSLKNLSALSHKSLSFSSVRSTMQFKPQASKESIFGSENNSILRYDNGNTTYIYPYKFKVKAPKFKTPAPQQH